MNSSFLRTISLSLLLFISVTSVKAQVITQTDTSHVQPESVIYLKSKIFYIGKMLEQTPEFVRFETPDGRKKKIYNTSIDKIVPLDPTNPPVKYYFEDRFLDRLILSPTGFEGGQEGAQLHIHSGITEISLFPIKKFSMSGAIFPFYPRLFYMYKAKFIFLDTRLFHASVSGGKIGAFSSSGAYWAPALSIGTSKSFVNISTAFFKNDQENSKGVVATTLGYSKRLNHQLTLMNEGVMVFEGGDATLTMLGSSLKISRARYALELGLNFIIDTDDYRNRVTINGSPRFSLHLLLNKPNAQKNP